MKYTIFGILAVVALLFGPTAYADDSADEYYKIDERIEKMKSDLKLTDEQVKEVKPVMESYKDKLHEARKEKEDKLDAILTSEQKDQMKQYKAEKDEAQKGWWQF
jgi:Spy/CpxP family protein refolding chaperone